MTDKELNLRAYYSGRNSVGDLGEIYYTIADHPEFNTVESRKAFCDGVRDIKSELRLNADAEWDE